MIHEEWFLQIVEEMTYLDQLRLHLGLQRGSRIDALVAESTNQQLDIT